MIALRLGKWRECVILCIFTGQWTCQYDSCQYLSITIYHVRQSSALMTSWSCIILRLLGLVVTQRNMYPHAHYICERKKNIYTYINNTSACLYSRFSFLFPRGWYISAFAFCLFMAGVFIRPRHRHRHDSYILDWTG